MSTHSQTAPFAVETHQLTKTFGAQHAVDHVDLEIPQGQIHAVLGPNGAGKTTLIRMLTTLLKATSGHASILGHDVVAEARSVRSRIASTGQSTSLDEDLTGLENLSLLARLRGHRGRAVKTRAKALLEAFGLSEAAGRQVQRYSGGMRRRLDIAASLLVHPDVLFLDEPTTGLDPRSRNQVWDIIRMLVTSGTTVVLSTQYLDEADQLADQVTVIDTGRIVAQGTPAELKTIVGTGIVRVRLLQPQQHAQAAQLLSSLLGATVEPHPDKSVIQLRVSDISATAPAIAELQRQGVMVAEFSLGQPSLDEVFLALTAQQASSKETP